MKKTLFIISLISTLLLSSGCMSYMALSNQTFYSKLDALGVHDYYALMPPRELKLKLEEKGYTLLDEYKFKKLYMNLNVKDKYIVTLSSIRSYNGNYETGWRIIAVDEQIPEAWEGKKEYRLVHIIK